MSGRFAQLEASLNMLWNIQIGSRNRLNSLKVIEDYASGLPHLDETKRRVLDAAFKALREELSEETVNEDCVSGYTRIFKEILDFNRSLRGPVCLVFGDNWLAQEMKKRMRAENYCVLDWHSAHPAFINEYDLYLLCDEPLNIYNLPAIQEKEKILKLWDYLKYKFLVFPSFYEVYMELKKQRGQKVRCIVTGNTNVKSAIQSRLLHTKTVSLANRSQDIFYDYHMFLHALEEVSGVEYAVIGLEPYSLHYDASRSKVEWRRCLAYYPIVRSMHNCNDAKQLTGLFEAEDRKIGRYFEKEAMTSLYDVYAAQAKKTADISDRVYDSTAAGAESAALYIREISEQYNKPCPEVVQENRKILEEYASACMEKGIRALFVIPPYTDWYKEHMKKEYYEELTACLDALCKKSGAQLLDLFPMRLPDCCFASYAEVNCLGAVKVASRINELIDNG